MSSVACLTNGEILVSRSHDNTVWFWEMATGKKLFNLRGYLGGVSFVVYSLEGLTVASGGDDGFICV